MHIIGRVLLSHNILYGSCTQLSLCTGACAHERMSQAATRYHVGIARSGCTSPLPRSSAGAFTTSQCSHSRAVGLVGTGASGSLSAREYSALFGPPTACSGRSAQHTSCIRPWFG